MKKILFIVFCLATIVACKNEKATGDLSNIVQNDSLQKIIAQRDQEINDMVGMLNDVEEGFRAINKAEERVTIAKEGEGQNKQEQIKENIQFIQQRMQQNREQNGGDAVSGSIWEGDKNIIAELDQTISDLNTNMSDLKTESEQKTQTINSQDKQLNTAWFAFGTKKELKAQNILVKGKVLQGNFNKSYFTKIDIRVEKEIKLYSKSAKILTMHPSSSYSLTTDAKDQYVLRITNPDIFWSTSKYLVIQVK